MIMYAILFIFFYSNRHVGLGTFFYIDCVISSLSIIFVSLYTAWINEASKKALTWLHAALCFGYDREVIFCNLGMRM